MKRILIALAIFNFQFSTFNLLHAQEPVIEGLSYYLPKTAMKFTVLVEKTTFTPGELADYASRYFMEDDKVLTASQSQKIINMKIDQYGMPDKEKHFSAVATAKNSIEKVYANGDGLLLSVNVEPQSQKTAEPFTPARKPKALNPREFMTQEMLSVGSQAKLAQLCAKEIYAIRESRNELSRGQAETMPKDGTQLRLMMEAMDKQEKALLQLFCGTTVCDTTEQVVSFCEEDEVSKKILFRFSDIYGLCSPDDLSGDPYYITVTDLKQTPEDTRTDKEIAKQKDETGLNIIVPGRARIIVYQQEREWFKQDIPYAQFGRLENVSGALFTKKVKTSYEVNPSTGAMMHLNTAPLQ